MDDVKKEVQELFDSLSRDELIELLTESGFEVNENGTGRVIYSDEHTKTSKIYAKVTGTFNTQEQRNTHDSTGVNSFPVAC
ncbi:hypothetical protein ACFYKX_09730 [Cytobacillus sp. FJAT-54145]|uniref:Uncharacterized protein n=1 Tax=Cytobacillus spartinae TaxID=3299023 RepID=A0ABW6KCC5_9BACI